VKKILALFMVLLFFACGRTPEGKDLEIEGKNLVSRKPPFNFIFPAEFQLSHSCAVEYPKENSLTRSYFFIKEKENRIEEMLIVQIADRTNPQSAPMTAPPLKPYVEKGMYSEGKVKHGEVEIEYLIQLMGWNPDTPSLQPIIQKGIAIPHHLALQGQFLFIYLGEHAVYIRYSRDVNSFGMKIRSQEMKKRLMRSSKKNLWK
jgi:hypothetical protein